MNIKALLLTLFIITFFFGVAFLAAKTGQRQKEALEKKKVVEAPIEMRFAWSLLVLALWLVISFALVIYLRQVLPIDARTELFYFVFTGLLVISVGTFLVFPLVANKTAKGKIKIENNKVIWQINDKSGQLDLSKSFTVSKAYFERSAPLVTMYAIMGMPTYYISYDIVQGQTKVSFYHDASLKEIKGLKITTPHGLYLHSHGRVIMNRIGGKRLAS